MYQRLVLVGNLGRDPEMRYTPNGTAVTTFPVATSRRWTDASGQLKEETAWFRVSVFGKQAEICNQYLAKGRRVLVEGELAVDEKTGGPRVYTRKDGTAGASFEVRANTVRFLTPKGEAGDNGGGGTSTGSPVATETGSMSEEELPF
ncbi:MAG TPA: single-stranded DNA-binding protein [Anaerolineae bacterium]|nr:single-stranded DNA-binding protein [Anaerolineae bacterium]